LRRDAFLSGRLFDEPTMTCVPAMGSKSVRYLALLTKIPADFGNVTDIDLADNRVFIQGSSRKEPIAVKASGIREILD
jgi:hypothetical protein